MNQTVSAESPRFQQFLQSAKTVPFDEFINSNLAKMLCVEEDWFPDHRPVSATIYEETQWIINFVINGKQVSWALVEKEERWGTPVDLALWIFNWIKDEYDFTYADD